MNAFRPVLRKPLTADAESLTLGASADAAWLVLEAANDLGDEVAIAACRRVIDASLNGASAAQADLNLIQHYFS